MASIAPSAATVTRRRRALESSIASHIEQDPTVNVSDSAIATIVPCLEEFLRVLSHELVAASNSESSSSEEKRQVSSQIVTAALETMGFADIANEAQQKFQNQHIARQRPTSQAGKRNKRKQEFSQELADAQEALLAASKRKMEGGPS